MKERGITLIALIITIVILIILAGIGINLTIGENGIFTKAKESKNNYLIGANKEEKEIDLLTNELQTNIIDVDKKYGTLTINIIVEDEAITNLNGKTIYLTNINNSKNVYNYTFKESEMSHTFRYLLLDNKYEITMDKLESEHYIFDDLKDSIVINEEILEKNIVCTYNTMYLYKEGDECIEITGGWQRGSYNAGTFNKADSYLYMSIGTGGAYYNSCRTVNKLNVSKFKLCEYEIESGNEVYYNSYYRNYLSLSLSTAEQPGYDNKQYYIKSLNADMYNKSSVKGIKTTYSLDIDYCENLGYICVYYNIYDDTNTDCKIYNVYLKK